MPNQRSDRDPGDAWTLDPTRRWFARCDTCGTFRLWADYFEVYVVYPLDPPAGTRWWWECARCLLETVTDYAERKARESGGRELSNVSHRRPLGGD